MRNQLQFLTGSGAVAHRGRQHQERSANPEATCLHGHHTQTLASRHLSRCLSTLTAEVERLVTDSFPNSNSFQSHPMPTAGTVAGLRFHSATVHGIPQHLWRPRVGVIYTMALHRATTTGPSGHEPGYFSIRRRHAEKRQKRLQLSLERRLSRREACRPRRVPPNLRANPNPRWSQLTRRRILWTTGSQPGKLLCRRRPSCRTSTWRMQSRKS